jgi:hypothetical protein
MRRLLFISLLALSVVSVSAQDDDEPKRNTYLNIGYAFQQLKGVDNGLLLNSDLGAAFTIGHTYYLHKHPIGNLLKIGLDVTFFDLNVADYTNYYSKRYNESEESDRTLQTAIGMHIGPSATLLPPVKGLRGHLYFRYAPSFSAILCNEEFYASYAGFWVSGIAVSYKIISLGMEFRWTTADYSTGEDDFAEKWQTRATRYYLSFKF